MEFSLIIIKLLILQQKQKHSFNLKAEEIYMAEWLQYLYNVYFYFNTTCKYKIYWTIFNIRKICPTNALPHNAVVSNIVSISHSVKSRPLP